MASGDLDGPDPLEGNSGASAGGISDDIVEQGGGRRFPDANFPVLSWRPSRGAAILAAIGLVAGLVAGYAAGRSQTGDGTPAASPRPAASGSAAPPGIAANGDTIYPALVQDVGACSAQVGKDLQLGVQVTNQSGRPVTLRRAEAILPLGGLRPIAQQWAPCGALPSTPALAGDGLLNGQGEPGSQLAPGTSAWFTLTFQVLMACPGGLPVQFSIEYQQNGHSVTARLPGFPDLGQVSYTGCASH